MAAKPPSTFDCDTKGCDALLLGAKPLPKSFLSSSSNASVAPPPRRTDHTYRDMARHPPDDHAIRPKSKSNNNFPAKLHKILSNPEHAYAICWQPHGRAWKIKDKRLFMEKVIPKYFVQSKYESFTRQLSGWGFKRLHQSGPDFNCYYHECFLRGLPHLTRMMRRSEPNLGKLLPFVDGEPNFYDMDLKHPLPPPEGSHDQHQDDVYASFVPPPYPNSHSVPPSEAYYHYQTSSASTHSFHDNAQPGQLYPSSYMPPPQYGYPPSQQHAYPYHSPHPQQSYLHPPPHLRQSYPYAPPHTRLPYPYPVMTSSHPSSHGTNLQYYPHLEASTSHVTTCHLAMGSNENPHNYSFQGPTQHKSEYVQQHSQNPHEYPQQRHEYSQQNSEQHDFYSHQLNNEYHPLHTESSPVYDY